MKNILLIVVFLGFIFRLNAQDALTTGNRILGGGVTFSQTDAENVFPYSNQLSLDEIRNNNRIAYSISPYFGRFYNDHQMIGLSFNVSGSNAESEAFGPDIEVANKRAERSFGLGGFLRQYFAFSDRFGVFVEEGIGLTRTVRETDNSSTDWIDPSDPRLIRDFEDVSKSWSGSIDAEVGIYFFLLNELSIETRLARFFIAYEDSEHTRRDFILGESQVGDGSSTHVNFRLINNFSFDQIFTLNYYF